VLRHAQAVQALAEPDTIKLQKLFTKAS